jgi:multidrug efflux system membrane fusion protein
MKKLLAALALTLTLPACKAGGPQKGSQGPVAVVTAVAQREAVPLELAAAGNVEASSTVSLRPRVTGVLERVLFREGQDVAAGAALFALDPQPFAVEVRNAEAALARAEAEAANAASVAARDEGLHNGNLISAEQFERSRATAAAAAAAKTAAQAGLAGARLNLSYATIRAPLAGRTGQLLVHPGDVLRANDTLLVTINQLRPAQVAFSLPERELETLRAAGRGGKAPVFASHPDRPGQTYQGTLVFVDNAVNSATGTILLKAVFANREGALWPGQFVNVVVRLGELEGVTVPARAVQASQAGDMVFVVKADQTVEARPIKVARTAGETVVVAAGLAAGETVVTDGQLRLTPGAQVAVKRTEGGEAAKP